MRDSDCPRQKPEPSELVSFLSLQLAFLKEDFPERMGHTVGAQPMVVIMPGRGTQECSSGYGPGLGSDAPDFSGFSTKIPAS